MKSLCAVFKVHTSMREWLSGGVSPCQGEGRGFESRLALLKPPDNSSGGFFYIQWHEDKSFTKNVNVPFIKFTDKREESL